MRKPSSIVQLVMVSWLLSCGLLGADTPRYAEPVAMRAESLLVSPTNQPAARVVLKNVGAEPYQGEIELQGPAGWRIVPDGQHVSLKPGETKRVSFRVEKALAVQDNTYPLVLRATGGGTSVTRRQNVVCAAAPYFQPTVDGDPSDWGASFPVSFTVGEKQTVVRTFWSRRQFYLLVSVQEDRQIDRGDSAGHAGFDCVQIALAPRGARTPESPSGKSSRFEFLLASENDQGVCYQLATPGMSLREAQKTRRLDPLGYEQSVDAVRRMGDVTHYECSLSLRPLRSHIEPIEGREFCFSVLVHDPDGTGIRDWGEAAGLWPWQRNALAWCRFENASWGAQPPQDSKLPWGFYSSKY